MNPTTISNNLFDTLNESQREAAAYEGRHLLVVAGPGTGKTHTLTHRISLYAKKLKSGQKILAVTFTNKAADELHKRLKQMIHDAESLVLAGTFHHFCWQLLKRYPAQGGLNENTAIAGDLALEEAAKSLWPQRSKKERRDILNRISHHKSVAFDQPGFAEWEDYNAHLKGLDYLDYDDVILKAIALLEIDPIRLRTQQAYPFVFVDEYQDINAAQHKLLTLLVGEHNQITAIGDPQQAIYGFRGSDIKYFGSFAHDFPNAKTVYLKDNYRSATDILCASSQVIAKSDYGIPPQTARIYDRGKLIVHICPNENAEAEYVIHQIEKLIGGTSMYSIDSARVDKDEGENVSFHDIAVLYRLNYQAHALKEAFERTGIPYHLSEKQNDEDDVCPPRGCDVTIEAQKVSLMSLHAAKGLEFSVVFIVGCEERLLPLSFGGLKADVEEERRLFYVGMTRAKSRLYLTQAKSRFIFGKRTNNKRSRFVMDIEERLKQYERNEKDTKKKQEKQLSFLTLRRSKMKKSLLTLAGILFLSSTVWATPPSDIKADYVKGDGKLYVYMDHLSRDHRHHYIKKTEILINGKVVAKENNRQQIDPSHYGFAISLSPKEKDEITITAYCSQGGSASTSVVIPEEKKADKKDDEKAKASQASEIKDKVLAYKAERVDSGVHGSQKGVYGDKSEVFTEHKDPHEGAGEVYGSKASAVGEGTNVYNSKKDPLPKMESGY